MTERAKQQKSITARKPIKVVRFVINKNLSPPVRLELLNSIMEALGVLKVRKNKNYK